MALIENLEFRVTEDNGGGITLAIKEDDQFIYIHSGYETDDAGQLIDDIKALFDGQHPSQWDGNELQDFSAELDSCVLNEDDMDDTNDKLDNEYWQGEQGVNVLMSQDFIELSMFTGATGQAILKNALEIDDIEDYLDSHQDAMPMDEFLALCN